MKVLLSYLSWSIVIVSVIISILITVKRRDVRGFLTYFCIWILAGTFFELLSTLLARLGIHNIFVFHINVLIEFSLLTLFYHALLNEVKGPGIKSILWPGLLLILSNSLFIQKLPEYNSYTLAAVSLGTIFITIYYYVKLFDSDMEMEDKMMRFILTGTVLVIHSAHVFPLLFGNFVLSLIKESATVIWVVRASIVLFAKIIIFYTLVGHFMHIKDQKSFK